MPEHQQTQQSTESKTTFQKQATPLSQTPISHPMAIIQRARINPKSLTHADVMQLQRTIGNRAVGRLFSELGLIPSTAKPVQKQEIPDEEKTCPSCIQRQEIPEEEEPLQGKLIEPIQRQEPEEEEKLQMKSVVQRQEIPEEEEPLQGKLIEHIQRQEIPEEEEPLQGKFENKPEIACPSCLAAPIVQRQEIPEEEEPLQGKMIGTIQRQEIPEEEEPLQTKRENNTGMPDNLKAGVENLSGIDMNDVRVHYNSSKPTEIGALAYTQGTNIHVAPSQEKHLPHEAWHVVQQAQGRVQPTMQLKGVAVNDDNELEREADVMGTKALQLIDNRPAVFVQRKQHEAVNDRCASEQITTFPNVDSVTETQMVRQLQTFISGKMIQRTWDTSGKEPVYRDDVQRVTWHLCSDGELWYETHQESSPYADYAGIKNKGSYSKWFMLAASPFELLKEQASTIQIPKKDDLDKEFHEAYQLYVYLIGISTLKWRDIVEKPPFSNLGWKVKKVYEHYKKHVNPLVEKEDSGLDAYYGPFYKRINPFLRAIHEKFGDKRYDEIIEGNVGNDSAELVKILSEKSKKAGFTSDIDESTLMDVLAEIRGAKKDIKKYSEIKPINNKEIPTVYRGDFAGLVEIMAKECGFDKAVLDKQGTLNIGTNWTQFQFVSTTTNKKICPPADIGTIWNIKLGPRSKGILGGLYKSEQEVLFAPKTSFYIEKIVTAASYDKSGPVIDDKKTEYIVFAHQGE